MGRRVTIQGKDGSFSAYVADGKTRDGPAIIVIQEIFGVNRVMRDIAATIAWVRAQGHRKVGAEGYCLGGLLAYLTGTRTDIDATVGYYGVGIDNYLGEAAKAKKPVLLHIAEEDGFVSKDSQAKMKGGLTNPNYQLYSYPGRDHAFARDGGKHYHRGDANKANDRTMDFFGKHLR